MPGVVWVHIAWMALAVAAGVWSGYLGLLRALQGRALKGLLPGRFNRRRHVWTGMVFYGLFYSGLVYALVMQNYIFGVDAVGLWIWHEYIAVACAIIYFPAMFLGFHLLARPAGLGRGRSIAHMITNGLACALVGVQVVLAILVVTEVL